MAELASCDGYYRQVEGLAMGSAPAPHLANGWLRSFDDTIKGSSLFYARYMDDIICIVKKTDIDSKLYEINNLHPSLFFIVEIENEGKLSFLNMIIYDNNGQLSSGRFRKSPDTGLILNFHSLAPPKYKIPVGIGFVHRIYRTCSSWQLHVFHNAIEEAKTIFS